MSDPPPTMRPGVPCAACPLRRLATFRADTAEEIAFIQSIKIGERVVRARTPIIAEGSGAERLYTLLSGWAFRYKTLPDGRRQILNFLLPGDLIGLQAKLFGDASHGVEALTDVTLCAFARDRVWDVFRTLPQIAFDITWLAANEESLVDDTLLAVGRRSSLERMGGLLLWLHVRADALGLGGADGLALPLTQVHLADALGMSTVHANRTLQALRRRRLFTFAGGVLRDVDVPGLRRLTRSLDRPPDPRPLI